MDEMFLFNPDMAQVARHCALSEFHFFRSFKQAFGITPYRYLLNLRLEHSKKLLEGNLPVKEIARQCGFADIFTYSKAFKRAYMLSPTAFMRA
jgi:AraC-like DNA-binding protein